MSIMVSHQNLPDGTLLKIFSASLLCFASYCPLLHLLHSSFTGFLVILFFFSSLFFKHMACSISAPLHLLFPLSTMLLWVFSFYPWNRKQSHHGLFADSHQIFTQWGLPGSHYLMSQSHNTGLWHVQPPSPLHSSAEDLWLSTRLHILLI